MKLTPRVASLSLAASLSPTASAYTYGLGKSWLIGSGSDSSIHSVSTTFNPGSPPPLQVGELVLYPALSNGTGDLLMASIESWPNQSWCGGTTAQWCIRTSVFSNQRSTDGPFAPLDANEPVTLTFVRSADNNSESGWTQSAIVNGKVVSQLTYPSGPMTLFGITTECDDDCATPVAPQTYTNTTIVLESPDAAWDTTAVVGSQIYGEDVDDGQQQQPTVVQGLSSSDGGRVWTVDEITIPPLN